MSAKEAKPEPAKKNGMEQSAAENKPGESDRKAAASEKRRRELWLYVGASIAVVEMILAVGGVLYGFISSPGRGFGAQSFPWLAWGSLAIIIPAIILLAVHQADVGLFRKPKGGDTDEEWQMQLPQRIQRLYRIIKGAPIVVVLVGIVALGAALLTIDGAINVVASFGSALTPYLHYIIGGIAAVLIMGIGAAVWLNYRTRRLYAEYEFRREVLERTGVIIVDKGSTPLPPGGMGDIPYPVLEAGSKPAAQKALEGGDVLDVESREIPGPGDKQ